MLRKTFEHAITRAILLLVGTIFIGMVVTMQVGAGWIVLAGIILGIPAVLQILIIAFWYWGEEKGTRKDVIIGFVFVIIFLSSAIGLIETGHGRRYDDKPGTWSLPTLQVAPPTIDPNTPK